jgi:hypothetical protein
MSDLHHHVSINDNLVTRELARGRWIVMLFLLFVASVRSAHGQSGACQELDYKILSPSAIAINCNDIVVAGGRTAKITELTRSISTIFDVYLYAGDPNWLLLVASPASAPFAFSPQGKYSLVLTYTSVNTASPAATSVVAEPAITLDLSGTVTITPTVIASRPSLFRFTSHVAFADASGRLVIQANPGLVGANQSCTLFLQNYSQTTILMRGLCWTFKWVPSTLAALQTLVPELAGRMDIDLSGVTKLQTSLIPTGLPVGNLPSKNLFNAAPKVDPKSRVSPQKAPASKDVSQLYLNLNYAAGTGTAPGWQLDGKVAPILAMVHRFAIGPLATANVGGNKVSGQTYTDSIDLGATAGRIFEPSDFLPLLTLATTTTYETDKEFNRDNILGVVDLKYNFKGFYNTQSIKALRKFYCPTTACHTGPQPVLSDIPIPPFGFAFDFHTGIEAGRAIVDKTVNATTGKASLVLPVYSIFRVVPQVHGILQMWKISTDANVTGRYLVATENTVLQNKANELYLEHLQTWRGIVTVTSTYSDSSASHFGITITYTNGFAPPTYARVNSVQAGLLIKY